MAPAERASSAAMRAGMNSRWHGLIKSILEIAIGPLDALKWAPSL
jgi:hypothetical protein